VIIITTKSKPDLLDLGPINYWLKLKQDWLMKLGLKYLQVKDIYKMYCSQKEVIMKILQKINIAAFIFITIILASCSTINPYTGDKQVSKAVIGAGAGAATGAVVGLITGDDSRERRKHALIGAGVGVLAGGAVGYYMDVQEAKLRQKLAGTGVSVTRDGDNIILNMPGNVTFATDSSDINGDFFAVLDSVTIVVDEFDKTLVEVMGHTDSTGANAYNQTLSEKRAESVSQYFQSRDIQPLRLATYGYGEDYPVASNDSPTGRSQNRRVEIALVPLTKS
jgi:outer membrane protein OmpA-like peptidoglycan-associated protein